MKKQFTKETLIKTLRTFLQAFIPSLSAGLVEMLRDDGSVTRGAIIAVVIPAVAAGICALMNREEVDQTVFEEVPEDEFITEDESC